LKFGQGNDGGKDDEDDSRRREMHPSSNGGGMVDLLWGSLEVPPQILGWDVFGGLAFG
jgi:hypothetical protein